MSSPHRARKPNHPLQADRPRLEALKKKMYTNICGVMGVSKNPNDRPALAGGGGPDDVLSKALHELLDKPADYPKSWEALGMSIAFRRAVDAVRSAASGRQREPNDDPDADDGDAINLVAIDDEVSQKVIDRLAAVGRLPSAPDPEELLLEAERQQLIWDYAQDRLKPRDLQIFRRLHYRDASIKEVAEEFDLTERRIKQIQAASHILIATVARKDPAFPNRTSTTTEHEGDQA